MARYRKSNYQIRQSNRDYATTLFRRLCYGFGFTDRQQQQIRLGIKQGLSYSQIEVYAHPRFTADQMEQIRLGWIENLTFEQIGKYSWEYLKPEQMKQIRLGLQHGLSYEEVSTFLHPGYSGTEMANKRKILEHSHLQAQQENGNKTNQVNHPNTEFSSAQLAQIQAGMRNKKVARGERLFRKPQLTVKQIIQIQVGLEHGLSLEQIEFYARHKYNDLQMAQIRRGFESGLSFDDVREYASKKFSADEMRTMREQKEALINLSQVQPSKHHQEQKTSEENTSQREMTMPQTKSISMEPTQGISTSKTAFFSHSFEASMKQQHENTWNAWLQSKQVFLYEDSFAASILADSAAVEQVECEVLRRCPYTSCYIEAREEHENKLAFFAVLADNILRLLPTEDETVGQISELKVDQHFTCGEILTAFDDPAVKDSIMKMLQLYVCLCSAEMEDVQPGGNHTPLPPGKPQQTGRRGDNQGVPSWDVNVYTVTTQRTVRKYRRRQQSSSDTGAVFRRPHKRRAHWHHFWVGSKGDETGRRRIVKWVSEIDVNPTEDNLPVRVILVKK